jgi:hypothetical protein
MASASSAPRSGSSTTSVGVPLVQPSTLRLASWSAPERTPASFSTSRSGTPTNVAVEMYGPPTSLDTQHSVTVCSTSRRLRRSS